MSNETLYKSYRIAVPKEFEQVFSHFYIAENQGYEIITKNLLPSFQTILVFNFGATIKLTSYQGKTLYIEQYMVLGPIKKSFEYSIFPASKVLVVNFKDDAFYRFFGVVGLGDTLPVNPHNWPVTNFFSYLWEQLSMAQTDQEQITLILNFCKPYLKTRPASIELLANFENKSQNPIKSVAYHTQQSERTIQQQHKKYFGFTAKEKVRYARFLKTIQYLQNNTCINWQDVIVEMGYYDQSQLIHDFQYYLHLSPKQYLLFQQDICVANDI